MLSRQVCWSRGKRWRLIGQETNKDTRMLRVMVGMMVAMRMILRYQCEVPPVKNISRRKDPDVKIGCEDLVELKRKKFTPKNLNKNIALT